LLKLQILSLPSTVYSLVPTSSSFSKPPCSILTVCSAPVLKLEDLLTVCAPVSTSYPFSEPSSGFLLDVGIVQVSASAIAFIIF
jgi:hypothetical protein